MSTFADITLLECNRKESVEVNTDGIENSIFTNRMGDVVQLEAGDTIELKSGFINQRGCANPSSIEFKGEELGVLGSFSQSHDTDLYFFNDMDTNLNTNPAEPYNPVNDPTVDEAI